jgi:hypothetical protein
MPAGFGWALEVARRRQRVRRVVFGFGNARVDPGGRHDLFHHPTPIRVAVNEQPKDSVVLSALAGPAFVLLR